MLPVLLCGASIGCGSDKPAVDSATIDTGQEAPAQDSGLAGLLDEDADGYIAAVDCDDADPGTHPAADEFCDGKDNDCDGAVDEGAVDAGSWYPDGDGDGYGDADATPTLDCSQPVGQVAEASDCDDRDGAVHPGAAELLCDGVDSDCDGVGEGSMAGVVDGIEYEDLQKAIDVVEDDGVVYVCPGSHYVGLSIGEERSLSLESFSGSADDTILDGGGFQRILSIDDGSQVSISNITFQDGFTYSDPYDDIEADGGGAIHSSGSVLELRGCNFLDSYAVGYVGAIAFRPQADGFPGSPSLLLDGCSIERSRGDGIPDYDGDSYVAGAIDVYTGEVLDAVNITMTDSYFGDNYAVDAAAFFLHGLADVSLDISGCSFVDNESNWGVLRSESKGNETWTIEDSVFSSNYAEYAGSVFSFSNQGRTEVFLYDSLLEGNSTSCESGYCGAFFFQGGEYVKLEAVDTIFTGNSGGLLGSNLPDELMAFELTLQGCTVDSNSGVGFNLGGGNNYRVTVSDSDFNENTSSALNLCPAYGGCALQIIASTFTGNSASGTLIDVCSEEGKPANITVEDSIFQRNTADSIHGGNSIFNTSTNGVTTLSIHDSSFTENESVSDCCAAVTLFPTDVFESRNVDWGEGETDNIPGDLGIRFEEPVCVDDLGDDETFYCPGDGSCYCYDDTPCSFGD